MVIPASMTQLLPIATESGVCRYYCMQTKGNVDTFWYRPSIPG